MAPSESPPPNDDRLAPTARTELRRMPERAVFSRSELHAVLDAGFLCHLGLVLNDWPTVLPTSYGRSGDTLVVHGSVASRSLRGAKSAPPVCVTVTHLDGVVLARSVFEHSINYRSVMVFGVPEILDGDEKLEGLRVLSEHVVPGQWGYARRPTREEIAQTSVLRLRLDEVSLKVRGGGPGDDDDPDADLPIWAGEVPLRTAATAPVASPGLKPGRPCPPHLEAYAAGLAARLAPSTGEIGGGQ